MMAITSRIRRLNVLLAPAALFLLQALGRRTAWNRSLIVEAGAFYLAGFLLTIVLLALWRFGLQRTARGMALLPAGLGLALVLVPGTVVLMQLVTELRGSSLSSSAALTLFVLAIAASAIQQVFEVRNLDFTQSWPLPEGSHARDQS